MNGLLAGKVVIVSGVGPGMGRHIAAHALAQGAQVVMGARSVDYLAELADELGGLEAGVAYARCDVTDDGDCAALVDVAESEFGGLDSVIGSAFNTGTSAAYGKTLEDGDLDGWRVAFEVNLFGSLRLVKAAIPALKQRPGSSVVFVGSQITRRVRAGRGPYAASKAALLAAAQVLARELGPYDIRVNTVVPGRMWGPGLQRYIGQLAEQRGTNFDTERERMIDDMSLPRIPTDEECARVAIFLASDLSISMSGQAVDVNGGETFH